jgi:hypothetical protein
MALIFIEFLGLNISFIKNYKMNTLSPEIQTPRNSNVSLLILGEVQLAGGMKLSKWIEKVGISRTAAWRFRKEGKLSVVVRYGTAYVTAETIRNWFTDDGSKTRAFAKN